VIAVVVVVFRYVPLTSNLFVFSLVEDFAYDVAYEYADPLPTDDIVLIAIDGTSLQPQHLGRWPWSRSVHAELLSKVPNARVIAFDVLFTEPDERDPEGDERFAEAIRGGGGG